jgi:hypothetical protein
MKNHFHVDRGSCSTAQESYGVLPAIEPNQPPRTWQFVDDFHGRMGDDSEPDPLFFVETWTLGMTAAVENFKQRRHGLADRAPQSLPFRDPDSSKTLSFVQDGAVYVDFLSSACASASAGFGDAGWPRQFPQEPSEQAQSHSTQSQETQSPDTQDRSAFASDYGSPRPIYPMTHLSACQFLGVTPTSTPKQIKAAYRRMVSQWHPDRLEFQTEEVRQRATEQMAAINDAYHLLRSGLLQESA